MSGGVNKAPKFKAGFTAPAPDRSAQLFIFATAPPGTHFYSITQPPGGPNRTIIKVDVSGDVPAIGNFQCVGFPQIECDEDGFAGGIASESHSGTVEWVAPIRLGPGVKPEAVKIEGEIYVQLDEDDACYPLVHCPFSAILRPDVQAVAVAASQSLMVTPASAPPRLQRIAPQAAEPGKPLNVAVTVENAQAWKGKLQYSLGPHAPDGSKIDAETGVFTWTPAAAQGPGDYVVSVSAKSPDGRATKSRFEVAVAPPKEISLDLGNGVNLDLVLIPAGEFMMGSPDSEKDADANEKPQHRVRITEPFYLGKYLVTQEQWEAVMGKGNNPSKFKWPKNPVEQVGWDDCQQFLQKLDERPHPSPLAAGQNNGFRLPTEAQWEYACLRGEHDSLQLRGRRIEVERLRMVRQELEQPDASCRLEEAERLGTLRHARERMAVVRG